jgi:transposase
VQAKVERAMPRCIASPSLVALVLTNRFELHLPYYRQENYFEKRYHIPISRQTLCNWVHMAAEECFYGFYDDYRKRCLHTSYLQIDETPIKYIGNDKGGASNGYLWVTRIPGAEVVFTWNVGRGHAALESVFLEFKRYQQYKQRKITTQRNKEAFSETFETNWEIMPRIIQCDGYSTYNKLEEMGVILAACWAHVHRQFKDLPLEAYPQAKGIITKIRKLYDIEKQLQAQQASHQQRLKTRQEYAKPIVEQIESTLHQILKEEQMPMNLFINKELK